jgi:N6-L-threonylcarbamoyladenine synthase
MPVCILGIETSCDETSAAVVMDGRRLLSNVVFSQMDEHAAYGGVVPEIASRRHVEAIIPVIGEALARAGMALGDVDAIAATYGPGLAGALLVGLSAAKGLALAAGKPLIGVHHVCAHICASYLEFEDLRPPFTALAVSGGHSHIYRAGGRGAFELMGRTRDDAAGEALDKVARAAGLGYPGGPKLEAAARGGRPDAVRFPKARFADGPYDFSFSGVKTAALNCLNRERQKLALAPCDRLPAGSGQLGGGLGSGLPPEFMRDFFASFQKAVVDVLVENTIRAEMENRTGRIVLAGGVAANGLLRARFAEEAAKLSGVALYCPSPQLCTDNAAMVACAAHGKFEAGDFSPLTLNASPGAAMP